MGKIGGSRTGRGCCSATVDERDKLAGLMVFKRKSKTPMNALSTPQLPV